LLTLEFAYSRPRIQEQILALDRDRLANLPEGLNGAQLHWVDLDGKGLSGILKFPAVDKLLSCGN
jgi:hypothetical protein